MITTKSLGIKFHLGYGKLNSQKGYSQKIINTQTDVMSVIINLVILKLVSSKLLNQTWWILIKKNK